MGRQYARQELYDLVWSEPKAVLAKRLGISDVGLGKVCQRANIPVPPRGYWALRSAGKPVAKIPLPPRALGQSDTITVSTAAPRHDEPVGELPPPPVFDEPVEEVIQRAARQVGKVTVPKSLESPHHLVAKLLTQDDERRRKVAEASYYWDKPRFEAPAAKRRLRLINAILMAMTRAGFKPVCDGKDAEHLRVCVGEQWVEFSIEPTKASRSHIALFDENNSGPRQPLRIKVRSTVACPPGVRTEWTDTEDQTLESVIPDVVLSLAVMGELHYRADVRHGYDWLVKRKAEEEEAARKAEELAERNAREARLRQDKARQDHLFGQVMSWQVSGQLREFVAAVRQHPEAPDHFELVEAWSTWALAEADKLDPIRGAIQTIVESREGILGGEPESEVTRPAQRVTAQPASVSPSTIERRYFPGMPWFLRNR